MGKTICFSDLKSAATIFFSDWQFVYHLCLPLQKQMCEVFRDFRKCFLKNSDWKAKADGFHQCNYVVLMSFSFFSFLYRISTSSVAVFSFFSFFVDPNSIYSWSIDHILEHEFFCLGRLGSQGSKGKKVDLRNSKQLLRVFFSTFGGQNKHLKKI